MEAVFLAQRSDDSFDHRVAIKIIREERATQTNIHRFEQEQRILAQLNHPAIAQLYDGGITADGFPYIIMEYVDGTPMNDYCRINKCSIDEIVLLFPGYWWQSVTPMKAWLFTATLNLTTS